MMDKKAHIYFLMKDYESSRDILNQVIRINPKADVSLFHRGIVLIELADYEGAVRDLKEAFKLCPTDGYRTELNRAEKLLKTSIEQGGTDHYKTLGVDRSASSAAIKKAFKEKALKYHPDKHAHSPKEVQEEMEKKMKELSLAYRCLSDEQKKKIYDADPEDSSDDDEDFDFFFSQFFESMMGEFFSYYRPTSHRPRRRM